MGNEISGDAGKRKAKYRMGRAYMKGEEEKGKNLQKVTSLVKNRKVFQIWLKQSNA